MTMMNMTTKYYTIVAEVAEGLGDYGSTWLTVLNAERFPSDTSAIGTANKLATQRNTRVMVFTGKDRGKLIYDTASGPVTATTEYSFGKAVIEEKQ